GSATDGVPERCVRERTGARAVLADVRACEDGGCARGIARPAAAAVPWPAPSSRHRERSEEDRTMDDPTLPETGAAHGETVAPAVEAGPERKGGAFQRVLELAEWLGNLLPHPVTLVGVFATSVILVRALASWLGGSAPDPRPEGAAGRSPTGMIQAVSLLNAAGLRRIGENLVSNFVNFVPLGTVLVALLGVGVAEASGLLSAAIRGIVMRAPKQLITAAVVFTGVMSNTASEAGYVILVPLAAVIFLALGRHPLAGLAAAFAGVSGGYSANLLIGAVDPLLAGITEEAARLIDPEYTVHPAVNWYFMFVSTFLITALGTWVTVRIVEPKLGPYDPSRAEKGATDTRSMEPLSREEWKGLGAAAIAALVVAGLILLATVPENGVLRNPETGDLLNSPFLRGMVALIFVFFLVPGIKYGVVTGSIRSDPEAGDVLISPVLRVTVALIFVFCLVRGITYGVVTGSIRSDRDVINGMSSAMSSLGLYIVLVFFAAQFVAFFNWSNLGALVAV